MSKELEKTIIDVPNGIIQLEQKKQFLKELAESKKDLTIKDINDKEGYQSVISGISELRSERVAINKTRQALKAPIIAVGKQLDGIAKELIEITEPTEKQLQKRREAHEAEKEAEKQRKIEEEKKKEAERRKKIMSYGASFNGYEFELVKFDNTKAIKINSDEISIISDEKFENLISEFASINASNIKKKVADDELISIRKFKIKDIGIENTLSDSELLEMDNETWVYHHNFLLEKKQEQIEEAKKQAEERARIEAESKKKEAELKALREQKEEAERIAKEKEDEQQRLLDEQRKKIADLEKKERQRELALEEERKSKEAKEKAEKEGKERELKIAEERKANQARQKELAPIKEQAIKLINNSYESAFVHEDVVKNEEINKIIIKYNNDLALLSENVKNEITNL